MPLELLLYEGVCAENSIISKAFKLILNNFSYFFPTHGTCSRFLLFFGINCVLDVEKLKLSVITLLFQLYNLSNLHFHFGIFARIDN